MSDIQIRLGCASDLHVVARLLVAGDAGHASALPHIFNDRDTLDRAKRIMSRQMDGDAALLVAESNSKVVGLVHLEIAEQIGGPGEFSRKTGWVLSIDVEEQHRRKGIGKALMEAGEQWAASKGASHIEFDVWDFNHGAIHFYESLGYRVMSHTMSKSVHQ